MSDEDRKDKKARYELGETPDIYKNKKLGRELIELAVCIVILIGLTWAVLNMGELYLGQ